MQSVTDTSINCHFIYVDWFDSSTSRSLFKNNYDDAADETYFQNCEEVNTLSFEDNFPGSNPGFGFVRKYRVLSLFSSYTINTN